nr:ARID DNA-binding domain-containing protein [Tanacetum cinerariifolium]
MVEGSDEQNWNKIWYVGSVYKNHTSPTKSLFKRLKNSFKVLDKEEDERKFIFSYGVGEAIVETRDGALLIPNVYYTPGITMNMEKKDVQDYIDDEYLSMNGTLYAMKNEGNSEETTNKDLEDYTSSSDDFIVIT